MRTNLFVLLVACLAASPAKAQQPRSAGPTASERLEAAAASISRMKAAFKQVLGRAEQARKEKDVVKLNCVNEKLTQIRSLIKVAEQADLALRESITSKDGGGAAEFSKIAIARTKVDGLRADSEQCAGKLAYVVDERTTVEVEAPAGLPSADEGLGVARRDENPADDVGRREGRRDRFDPPPIVRPPPASPFR